MHKRQGAKSVMLAHKDELVSVPFPEGAVDLDTEEELENGVVGEDFFI